MSEVDSTIEYRTLPEYEGYRFGSDGSVWSRRRPGTQNGPIHPWRRLSASVNQDGYLKIHLRRADGKRVEWVVHRLILTAFHGPCPDGMQACHDPDPTRTNNAIQNLRWDTLSANQFDAIRHGTKKTGISEVGKAYIALWNSCADLSEFCAKTGKSRRKALSLASNYRRQGHAVKFYPPVVTTALIGERFGRWVVIGLAGGNKRLCRCDCGTSRIIYAGSLIKGASKSCSCGRRKSEYATR